MNVPENDDLIEDQSLAAPAKPASPVRGARPRRSAISPRTSAAGDAWSRAKTKTKLAAERSDLLLRENPVPVILGALAFGLALGFVIYYASTSSRREERKASLGKFDGRFLSLPFAWPFLKSVRQTYEGSADAVRSGVNRLRKIDLDDYTRPVRNRWKAWTR